MTGAPVGFIKVKTDRARNHNQDGVPDACRRDCTVPRCGDLVVDTGESCDGYQGDNAVWSASALP
jgi:hypothetical protein